jgi:hypothetical protein
MTEELQHAWVLEQIARDEQTARAMSHGIMHVESRWSVARLIADCAARRRIAVRHDPIVIHERGGVVACRCCGYGGEWPIKWPCDTFRDTASVYAGKPGFPEGLRPK